MESDGAGLPVRFFWHGRRRQVQHIVQRWQLDSDWWLSEGRVWRDHFAAITSDGLLFVAYYDHLTAEWRLAKIYD